MTREELDLVFRSYEVVKKFVSDRALDIFDRSGLSEFEMAVVTKVELDKTIASVEIKSYKPHGGYSDKIYVQSLTIDMLSMSDKDWKEYVSKIQKYRDEQNEQNRLIELRRKRKLYDALKIELGL